MNDAFQPSLDWGHALFDSLLWVGKAWFIAAVCTLVCPKGQSACGNGCFNLDNDPGNCGGCGKACNAGEVCSLGVCAQVCAGGTSQCGAKCADTSIRAMMDKRRETEKARIADAKARGEDAVTAASWVNKRSKREANPQLRFSCPKVASDQLQDRPRVPSSGRLLYVFDGAEYPLRHTSYQRTTGDQALALKDFEDTVAHFTRLYGAPTKTFKNPLPTPDKDGKVEFPTAMNFETSWEFADLLARVNVLRYGDLVTIGERVEVPHGLRPDAPRFVDGKLLPPRPAPAGAPTPAADAPAGTPTPATTAPAGAATPATTAPAAPQSSAPATPTSKP